MSDWRADLWYRFNFCVVWTGYTLGFSYRSVGSRNMPSDGPVLVLANHESFLDPLAVGLAVRRRLHYLARKTLFKSATFGNYLRSVGCIPVDQEGVAKEGLQKSIQALQQRKALLIFPEGERAMDGNMQAFKAGILLILRRVPVPIVPVGVAGAYEAYPRGATVPRFSPLFWTPTGAAVAAAVGKPILPERYAGMEREKMLDFLFNEVQTQVRLAERIVRDRD